MNRVKVKQINKFMLPYCELDFPFPVLKDFDHDNPPGWVEKNVESGRNWFMININYADYLSDDTINFFNSLEVYFAPDACFLFRGWPNKSQLIHIDGIQDSNDPRKNPREWSFNITWGSNDSEMYWYDTKVDINKISPGRTNINKPLLIFTEEETNLIAQCKINYPTLVQTNIPHKVINRDTNNYRWCLALRPIISGNKASWQNIVPLTSKYHKNILTHSS